MKEFLNLSNALQILFGYQIQIEKSITSLHNLDCFSG